MGQLVEQDRLHLVGWQLREKADGYEDGRLYEAKGGGSLREFRLEQGDGAAYPELSGENGEAFGPVFRWRKGAVAAKPVYFVEAAGEAQRLREEAGQPAESDEGSVGIEIVIRALEDGIGMYRRGDRSVMGL